MKVLLQHIAHARSGDKGDTSNIAVFAYAPELYPLLKAQLTAKLALDKMRREVHCASVATPTGTSSSVTITLPSYCKTGSGSVTWCTRSVATNRYALYRVVGSTCTGGIKWADYLTPSGSASVCSGALCIFNYTAQSTTSLAKLGVDFPVNVKPSKTVDLYELADDLVLRNSTRS